MKKLFLIIQIVLLASFIIGNGAQPVSAASKDKYGGVINVAYVRAAKIIGDPTAIRGGDGFYGNIPLEKLLEPDGKGGFVPALAESWPMASDKSSYAIKLKKGVKFHDGTDFNAQAVKWNLDRAMSKPLGYIKEVKNIEVIDDYTVRLNLGYWDRLILSQLAGSNYGLMVSPTAFEKNGEKWIQTNPVGTGAFKLKRYRREEVRFVKNNDYREKGIPYLDEVNVYLIMDSMTALATFLKGEVNILQDAPVESATQLSKNPKVRVKIHKGFHPALALCFDTTDPEGIWYDKRLRMAVEYAIDKEAINKTLGGGYTRVLNGILLGESGHPGVPSRTYNPEKAKELLAEAGYPNGFKTAMHMTQNYPRDTAVAMQGYLAAVGIQIDIEASARATYRKFLLKGPLGNKLIWAPLNSSNDPLMMAYMFWRSETGHRPYIARPAGFDDLISKAIIADTDDEMLRYLGELETLGYKEAMVTPLWTRPSIVIVNEDVVNDAEIYIYGSNNSDYSKAWVTKK